MKLKVHIQNIGKIKKGTITVRPFTILAGPNNTGKTLFSKTLYSVLDAMNDNLMLTSIQSYLTPLQESLRLLYFIEMELTTHKKLDKNPLNKVKVIEKKDSLRLRIKSIRTNIKQLEKLFEKYSVQQKGSGFSSLTTKLKNDLKIKEGLNRVISDGQHILSFFDQITEEQFGFTQLINDKKKDLLKEQVKQSIQYLQALLDTSPTKILNKGFSIALKRNMTGSFQVPQLHKLIKSNSELANIQITRENEIPKEDRSSSTLICQSSIEGNNIESKLSLIGWLDLQYKSRVVYLESPTHWKLRNALMRFANRNEFFYNTRKNLLVPKYWTDLNLMLMDEWSGEMAFPKIFQELTEQTLKGKMTISGSGSLQFKFKGDDTSHALPITATGVVQLGLLALLIEKKVLDKGTVLFIDEPETNLHPAWKVKMMQTLFQLAKEGAYIVMATHSADMMKWLEVYLKQNPEDKSLVAINQTFTNQKDGSAEVMSSAEQNLESQIKSVQENLIEPFLNLFLNQTGYEIPVTKEIFSSCEPDLEHEVSNKMSIKGQDDN